MVSMPLLELERRLRPAPRDRPPESLREAVDRRGPERLLRDLDRLNPIEVSAKRGDDGE